MRSFTEYVSNPSEYPTEGIKGPEVEDLSPGFEGYLSLGEFENQHENFWNWSVEKKTFNARQCMILWENYDIVNKKANII